MTTTSKIGRPPTATTRRIRRLSRLASLATAVAFVTAACTGATPESPASGEPAAVALPATPVGERAQWVVDVLNGDDELATTDIEAAISPVMLEQVPAEQMLAVFNQMRDARPWTPTELTESPSGLVVQLHSTDAPLQMQISVDEQTLINGLLFEQPPADRTPAASWNELEKNVGALDAETSMTVTPLDADAPGQRIIDVAGEQTKPLGSVFKLYVLGAVADAVAAGTLSWDDSVIITDDTRSLPSGELQDLPSGTLVSVRDAAQKMIEISDNTATDLLIGRVGRDAVEAQLSTMGHHDAAANTPLLTTREFFQLGWAPEFAEARTTWASRSIDERREVLRSMPAGRLNLASFDLSSTAWQNRVDWFADASDLVDAHVALQQKAQRAGGEPVREILSANPGLRFDTDVWNSVSFKGGSAPGVLAGSWLLERTDGARFVITLQATSEDPAALADPALIFGNVEDATALLVAVAPTP
ncbi:serine hydrolase [Agreia sp. COWG]|uniref:serine hydrolase n=1 Tax=Agreia sp. COWG TaxID=2773266 RepID=UPI00192555C8|nr:serine hydrolase [Agreia sp. COWG]CAD6007787.1 Beta-lactamase [Agreia sp. COWG]